jgi:hypothetical protein
VLPPPVDSRNMWPPPVDNCNVWRVTNTTCLYDGDTNWPCCGNVDVWRQPKGQGKKKGPMCNRHYNYIAAVGAEAMVFTREKDVKNDTECWVGTWVKKESWIRKKSMKTMS